MADYWEAIQRTNETGLASLGQYRLAFGPLAREHREWLAAHMPLFAIIERTCCPVGGIATVAMHPPGEPLPEELRQELQHLEDVVTATGTQVLEARDSDSPLADALSVSGRQERAILYLAVGDVEGNLIRRLVWERDGAGWRHSRAVLELATTRGLSRAEYHNFREALPQHLPPADDPDVLTGVNAQGAASLDTSEFERPWITFADISDLIRRRVASDSQSDQVTSGQEDR